MPRIGRGIKPADETTEGHRPSPRHDLPVEDAEGHGRRMPAPVRAPNVAGN